MTPQEELEIICLHKEGMRKRSLFGEVDVNEFKDADCFNCQNYHSAIGNPCPYYTNRMHLLQFRGYQLK